MDGARSKDLKREGAGMLFFCQEDSTILLLKRSYGVNEPGTWGTSGGYAKSADLNPFHTAQRESLEEMGALPDIQDIWKTFVFNNANFQYTTHIVILSKKEKDDWSRSIRLNWENDDAQWFNIENLPKNLHFGIHPIINCYFSSYHKLLHPH